MAVAPTAASATNNLINVAGLLQNLLVGKPPTRTGEAGSSTQTRTGQASETTESTTGLNAEVFAQLMQLMTGASQNAKDPVAANALVQDIIRKAVTAFAPQLGREASSGLYNSATRKQLAGQAMADATSAASQALLNFITQQQSVAANVGNTLAQSTRTTAQSKNTQDSANVSGTTTNRSTTTTDPILGGGLNNIAMLGLLGYSALKGRGKIGDLVGELPVVGDIFSSISDLFSPAAAGSVITNPGVVPPIGVSPEVINLTDIGGIVPKLDITGGISVADEGLSGFFNSLTDLNISGLGDNISSIIPDLPNLSDITDIDFGLGDILDFGDDIIDVGDDIFGGIGDIFSDAFTFVKGLF